MNSTTRTAQDATEAQTVYRDLDKCQEDHWVFVYDNDGTPACMLTLTTHLGRRECTVEVYLAVVTSTDGTARWVLEGSGPDDPEACPVPARTALQVGELAASWANARGLGSIKAG